MKLSALKSLLRQHPTARPRFVLPHGRHIPAHFHVTEVGSVTKRFIDCGGVLHDTTETCLLQTHVGHDTEHRLAAGRFAQILDLGGKILSSDEVEVEVEYDDGVAATYSLARAERNGAQIELHLQGKKTACLAQQRRAETEPEPAACGCC